MDDVDSADLLFGVCSFLFNYFPMGIFDNVSYISE